LIVSIFSDIKIIRWRGKISQYQGMGKLCITAAVCEQSEASMMGNTLTLLNDFSRDIGLELVKSIAALRCFEAGSIKTDGESLLQAEQVGQALRKLLVRQPRHRGTD